MIVSWMLYGAAVALLFGVAASALERVVRQRGWPVRGLWAGAMLASLMLPGLALVAARAPQPAAPVLAPVAPTGEAGWLDPLGAMPTAPTGLDPGTPNAGNSSSASARLV